MEVNKTNLVDLTLLNTAYKINKRRIDLLSEKVITEELKANNITATSTLNVGETTTVNGNLTVNSGTLNTNTLDVTGGMTINGGGVTLPNGKALTLNGGGSVTKSANFDSLTGSVKFGNAISNGNVTGSAQIVVPTGESLSLSGSANVNSNTTIEGTITSGNIIATEITANGSAVLKGSTISSDTTISNGTIDLNKKTLQLSEGSTTNTSKISNGTISTSITNSGTTGSIDLNNQTLKLSSTSTSSLSGGTISTSITNSGTVGGSIDLNNQTLKLSEGSTSKISNGIISASITNSKTTGSIDLNGKTLQLSEGSTSKISNGIISASITNSRTEGGSIDLNGNDLTVTNDSIITAIIEGDKTTIEGVAAIKAKSMELTNTANNSSSLIINNTFGGNITDPNADLSKVALYCTGGIKGAKVFNAVWNDLADAIEVPSDTELEFGYCYKYKDGRVYKTDSYSDSNILGIHSDTAGMILGLKEGKVKCINLAVAGVVLAYVDKEYECGTALVATKEGKLTKANILTRLFHPERVVGTFYKKELQESWGTSSTKVKVNGRSWVKVK